jgi:hypothetical protein
MQIPLGTFVLDPQEMIRTWFPFPISCSYLGSDKSVKSLYGCELELRYCISVGVVFAIHSFISICKRASFLSVLANTPLHGHFAVFSSPFSLFTFIFAKILLCLHVHWLRRLGLWCGVCVAMEFLRRVAVASTPFGLSTRFFFSYPLSNTHGLHRLDGLGNGGRSGAPYCLLWSFIVCIEGRLGEGAI